MSYRFLINSKDRYAGSHGFFEVNFKENIQIEDSMTYNMYLDSAEIPFTFYNVDYRNNQLILFENDTQKIITLSAGSYTIESFIQEVKSKLQANATTGNVYDVTYNQTTGKLTISATLGNPVNQQRLSFTLQNSAHYLLGFDDGQQYTFTTSLTAPNVQNIQTVYEKVYIRTSLFTNTFDTSTGYRSDILEKIQINNLQPFKDTIYYRSHGSPFKTSFRTSSIDYLTVRITDARGRELDFQGHDWSLSIVVEPVL